MTNDVARESLQCIEEFLTQISFITNVCFKIKKVTLTFNLTIDD